MSVVRLSDELSVGVKGLSRLVIARCLRNRFKPGLSRQCRVKDHVEKGIARSTDTM